MLISISTLALGSQVFVIVGWLIAVFVCVCARVSSFIEAPGDKLCAVLVSVDIVLRGVKCYNEGIPPNLPMNANSGALIDLCPGIVRCMCV